MSGIADYLDMNFGPLHNHVAHAELLDKAGELISSFLKAQGLAASPRIFCREKASAPPLLIIVTPSHSATDALEALDKSNARHPQYPFMDFKSVAVPVRNESGEEGVLFNAGQPVIHSLACSLTQQPA